MKIAIFHNFLDNIGGAEIVSLTLAREFDADIYTTNIDEEKIKKIGFENVLPRIFSIGKVPLNAPFRQQIALLRFRFLNLNKRDNKFFRGEGHCSEGIVEPQKKFNYRAYDYFIIAGDWAMSGAVNNKPNLWYVHSPIREIWDLKNYTKNNLVTPWKRPLFDVWVFVNRYLNKKYIKHVQKIACNSQNTKNRVKKYLNRDAEIIYPPIETSKFHHGKTGDYWLSVNRLISHKRVDLQLKAFSSQPDEKLIIIGSYEKSAHFQKYAEKCIQEKTSNVEIKSWVSEEEKINLLANCKGFITTSKDEDFGMNVVEAMASGKPVVAPAEGGYLETIINGTTGILIDNIDEFKLVESIKKINSDLEKNPEQYKNACMKQAQKFDTKIFIEKISRLLESR